MTNTSAPTPAYLRQDVKSSQPPAIVGMNLQNMNDEKGSHKCESGDKCQHKANRLRGGGAARDCFMCVVGCFLCFECCEVCCGCIADVICCPCETCCCCC